jgi:hypothetical protein
MDAPQAVPPQRANLPVTRFFRATADKMIPAARFFATLRINDPRRRMTPGGETISEAKWIYYDNTQRTKPWMPAKGRAHWPEHRLRKKTPRLLKWPQRSKKTPPP